MNKLKWILPLFALAIMLGGCPYQSENALDKPSIKVNPILLGAWEPKSSSDDKYTVTKDDEFTYKIEKKGKEAKDVTHYKAFLSKVDDSNFLNLWEDNGTTPITYYFYKVELNSANSKVTLSPVTENITEKFATGDEMKAFFKKYKNISFFYGKDAEVLIKD